MSTQYNVSNAEDLNKLEEVFKKHLFVNGDFPTLDDKTLVKEFTSAPSAESHPHLHAWFTLVNYFVPSVQDHWVNPAKKEEKKPAAKKASPQKEAPKTEEKKDDDIDLFADDDENEAAKLEEIKKKKEEEKAATKKAKPALVPKSMIILDVKVWEPDQVNYDELAGKIIAKQFAGLTWKSEYKIVDIGFTVKKIVIGCVIEDDVCSIDDVIDKITEELPDDVQSIDIAAFNKI